MRNRYYRKSRIGSWCIVALLTSTILLVPVLGALPLASADPPRHAPAWGYRAKKGKKKQWKKRSNNNWSYRRSRAKTRRYRSNRRWSDRRTNRVQRNRNQRRYRTFYRTRRDRNGNKYREYYRVYYR